jgi:hypothetical protein
MKAPLGARCLLLASDLEFQKLLKERKVFHS